MLTWPIVDCTNKRARPGQVSVELPYVARPPQSLAHLPLLPTLCIGSFTQQMYSIIFSKRPH
jgi:hypothetical protein